MRILFVGCILTAAACASAEEGSVARELSPTPPIPIANGASSSNGVAPPPSPTPTSTSSTSVPDAAAPVPEPPPPPTVITSNETIEVWGRTRSFVVARPSTYDPARSYPLLLALHGDGGTGAHMRAAFQLDGVAGQDVIVAYPTGSGNSWDLYTPADSDKDVAFLVALVDEMKARYNVAPNRVFSFGMSSGAFMSNQMACRRPSLFRGIVSHSGGVPAEPNDSHGTWGNGFVRCDGQDTGVAAMLIHGSEDSAVPYPSGEHNTRYWATVNGCASTSTAIAPAPCVARDGCPAGKPVVFCGVQGLGHAFWSEAAAATWSFVSGL
ncbi:MAG: prolyl oligopeptidase family serine peptidase [Labilithrix sp.]|nr:prolyl oligopeptidase family serine peptidase [Labilithrix sp.]MCW5813721.1 prolyl oligopeptidase family serine peptidase [Labilithrix sp.]